METTLSQGPHYWGPILSTHPLRYKELLIRSLRLYFASFSRVFMLSFLLSVLVFIPRLVAYVLNYNFLANISFLDLNTIWIVALNITILFVLVGIFWHLHCTAHYKQAGFKQDFNVGIHKIIYVFCALVLQNLMVVAIIGVGYLFQIALFKYHFLSTNVTTYSWPMIFTLLIFVLQFALIIYVSTLFLFLIPIIAIEDEHIIASIKRTVSLTWNHWWMVFSTQITPWVCLTFFSICIKYISGVGIHYYLFSRESFPLAPILLQIIIFALFIIWPVSLIYIQLKDLELRKKAELNYAK